jgi:hypothetical protein
MAFSAKIVGDELTEKVSPANGTSATVFRLTDDS